MFGSTSICMGDCFHTFLHKAYDTCKTHDPGRSRGISGRKCDRIQDVHRSHVYNNPAGIVRSLLSLCNVSYRPDGFQVLSLNQC